MMSYPNVGGYNSAQMGYAGGQQGGYGASAPGGYGNYPGGHGGYPGGGQHSSGPPSVNPDIQRWFSTVDRDHSGKISAKELQAALVNGQGRNFSDQACTLMIGMFDRDKSGTIDVQEFQQLYNYINQWIATFRTYDRDNSGHIEEAELTQAFQQMGFRFSTEFIKFLITKSDLQSHAKITVDQFIVLCVQIQRFTGVKRLHVESESYIAKSKRKLKGSNEVTKDEEFDEEIEEIDDNEECKVGSAIHSNDLIERLKAEMSLIIQENSELSRENKLLTKANCALEKEIILLKEQVEKFRHQRENALELSNWLAAVKEVSENLSEKMKHPKCRSHHCDEMEPDPPYANGSRPVKMERTSDGVFQGEEYHTPLLNFDQVDFPLKEERLNRPIAESFEADGPIDDIGRDQLLHPEPLEGVCELCPGSRIYVSLSAMDNIMNKRTHSSVARSCLEAIFKSSYLLSCSVQGNVAKGPYGKPEFQRPSLYKPAVDCILKFARYFAERNGWKIEEVTTIKKQMNTRLSELRNVAKSKNPIQNVNPSSGQKSDPPLPPSDT